MGTDELFRKRKGNAPKRTPSLQPIRSTRARLLIVCEGERTEPFYFEHLCQKLRISGVTIKPSTRGSSPQSVVKSAEELFETDSNDAYDEVYCVFDRDEHTDFNNALRQIETLQRRGKPFHGIISYPCFEYWFLLHFKYSRSPFAKRAGRSLCDCVIRELREAAQIKEFSKSDPSFFDTIFDHQGSAIERAIKAHNEAINTNEPNPSTEVYRLVKRLQSSANPP